MDSQYLLLDLKDQLDRIEKMLIEGEVTGKWISLKKAAAYTSLSVTTIRRAIMEGSLKASKKTGKLLLKKQDIDRFLKS